MSLVRSVQASEKIHVATSKNEQIRILLERQKEQIVADCGAEIQKHEFQADYDGRSILKLNGVIESQRSEKNRALAGDEQLRRDQQLLRKQLLEQNGEHREAHVKSLNEMDELNRFQGSTFDTLSRIKLVEDRDTILEFTAKIQELQNEVHRVNDSRDFQDAESVRSGHSHVTSQPVSFPPIQFLVECEAVLWECRAATTGGQAFGTRMENRETFLQIQRRLLQHLFRRN